MIYPLVHCDISEEKLFRHFSGFGFGLMYLPAIVMVGFYFEKRRAFATGVAVCGSGIGGFIFAPLCEKLLSVYSWKGATWIIAGICLNGVVMGSLFRPLESNKSARQRALSQSSHYDVNSLESGTKAVVNKENGVAPTNKPLQPKDLLKERLKGDLTTSKDTETAHNGIILQSMQNLSPTALGNLDKSYSISCDCIYQTQSEKEALERRVRDLRRPLYRKDIFYSGSVANLPEFKASNQDITSYVASMTSIPEDAISDSKTGCLWSLARMCKSLTDTMKEMMDFSLMLNPVFAVYGLSCFLCMAGERFPLVPFLFFFSSFFHLCT